MEIQKKPPADVTGKPKPAPIEENKGAKDDTFNKEKSKPSKEEASSKSNPLTQPLPPISNLIIANIIREPKIASFGRKEE